MRYIYMSCNRFISLKIHKNPRYPQSMGCYLQGVQPIKYWTKFDRAMGLINYTA